MPAGLDLDRTGPAPRSVPMPDSPRPPSSPAPAAASAARSPPPSSPEAARRRRRPPRGRVGRRPRRPRRPLHLRRRRRHRRRARAGRHPQVPARPARPQRRCRPAHGTRARADVGELQPQLEHRHPARLRLDPRRAAGAAGTRQRGRGDVQRSRPGRLAVERRVRQRQGRRPVPQPVRGRGVDARGAGHPVRRAAPSAHPRHGARRRAQWRRTPRGRGSAATRSSTASNRSSPPEQVAKAVVHVAGDPDAGAEYRLDGAGLHLLP